MKKRKCTIVVNDEVNCTILGLSDTHYEYFFKKYSILVPSRFHMAKFKLGIWDGTIAFFSKTGVTYVNLLEEIVPYLSSYGYKITVTDKRKAEILIPDPIDENYLSHVIMDDGNPLVLRDHQVRLVNALIENGGGLGKAATGAGKTFVTGALTLIYERLANLRVLTIVPNTTLVRQTHKDYVKLGLDAGIYYGKVKQTDTHHLVSTWQSLKNNPHLMKRYDVVIVDEVHMAKGPILQDLLLNHGKNIPYRFGVTGTLHKEDIDQMAVRIAVGEVVVDVPAIELINKKILSNLSIEVFELEHNFRNEFEEYKNTFVKTLTRKTPMTYTEYKDSYMPDYAAEKQYNQQHEEHLIWTAAKIEEYRDLYGNVLYLTDGVKHGQKLSKLIEGSYALSGKDSVEDREHIYEQYATRNDIITFATAQIASTGLDIKRIYVLGFSNFGKSGIKVIQSVGRGLRTDNDKDFVRVLDISHDMKYARRHTAERIKFYKEAEYPYQKKKQKFASIDSKLFD